MTQRRFERYKSAYLEMAKATRYRPGEPSDGWGNIADMSAEQLCDPSILDREAANYAKQFVRQDDEMEYHLGCPNGGVNKAFLFVIEAAHLLCSDGEGNRLAPKLLELAIEEIKRADREGEI
jgi:hypothetical protein